MPAAAETVITVPLPCMDTHEYEAFKERHGESLVAFGVTSAGVLVQRIESPSGTWTLILQTSGGMYCALATGEGWHAYRKASGQDS